MTSKGNTSWNLERFLDSLIIELDKAQDTLAVKGINRRLTYTVKDMEIDLHVFPQYTGRRVVFKTAKPGETGASKLSIQLGSITDRQIKEHTADPVSKDEITIDEIEDLDEDTKDAMRSIGVNSTDDLMRMERRNVNVEKVVAEKSEKKKKGRTSYKKLADLIQKTRRKKSAPRVMSVSLSDTGKGAQLSLDGDNLVVSDHPGFPAAVLNGEPVKVVAGTSSSIRLDVGSRELKEKGNSLQMALDPYAVISLEIDS